MAALGPSLRIQQTPRQSQSQTLTITPALRQSLRILQMSADELEGAVRDAIESNPLLQPEEVEAPPPSAELPRPRPRSDLGFQPFAQMAAALSTARGAGPAAETGDEATVEAPDDGIEQDLAEEIAFGFDDAEEREIAHMLGGLLDEAGYLAGTVAEVAELCDAPQAQVEAVLEKLQSIFGSGLFARDLAECLTIQLHAQGAMTAPMAAVVANLQLVAEGRAEAIAEVAGVAETEIVDAIGRLRRLDPRPGLARGAGTATTVVPDLLLSRRAKDAPPPDPLRAAVVGRWLLEINPEVQPNVGIDESQYRALRSAARRSDDRDYLSDRLREARWLLRTLQFRAASILRIGAAIVERQSDFFEQGVSGFRPLTRREVAEAAEVHESTVSRVVSGKYLAWAQGTHRLDWFFSPGIEDAAGGAPHSARLVQHRLRALVRAEGTPLSDAALAARLHEEGFALARRTVAKYRELMGIPASAQRRRWRRLSA